MASKVDNALRNQRKKSETINIKNYDTITI